MPTPDTVTIPRLTTPRLLLRAYRRDDFDAFAADAADPLARAHMGGVQDRRTAWRHSLPASGSWVIGGMGWWIVEDRERGVVGSVGVFRREVRPDVEMGWVIHRPHWGRGFASEAAAAALRHAMEVWRAGRVIAIVGKGNEASAGVARKIGMRREGEIDYFGETDDLFVFEEQDRVATKLDAPVHIGMPVTHEAPPSPTGAGAARARGDRR